MIVFLLEINETPEGITLNGGAIVPKEAGHTRLEDELVKDLTKVIENFSLKLAKKGKVFGGTVSNDLPTRD